MDAQQPDPYRDRFYDFEREARQIYEPTRPSRLGLNACARLVDAAFRLYRVTSYAPIRFSAGPGLTCGQCYAGPSEIIIRLPACRRRPWTALHEAAHAMLPFDGHGPRFASVVLDLWVTIGGWPQHGLHVLAAKHDVPLEVELI